jgi:phosphoribosyl 1,2-cyclic phosphate phosphodiesterase
MIITFLGTSAAHPYPDPPCECPNCRQARLLGGKSIRKRSSLLVNDDLLIDPGPDVVKASHQHGVSLSGLRTCLVTHAHGDHLDVSHLLARQDSAGAFGEGILHLYASTETLQIASAIMKESQPELDLLSTETQNLLGLDIHPVESYQRFNAGDYRVTAFPANHAPGMGALLYSVEADGCAIFYGTDTAALREETWGAFHRLGLRFDLVILDHTNRPEHGKGGHLNAGQVREHVERMRREGILKEEGRVFATHFEHEHNPPHPQLVELAAQGGYEAAYDGLVVEV